LGFFAAGLALVGHRVFCAAGSQRLRQLLRLCLPGGLTLVLIAPFLSAESAAVAARHGGAGVALGAYPVFGPVVPAAWRPILDLPAFWFVLLPFLFPAVLPAALAFCRTTQSAWRKPFSVLALACLCGACVSRSTFDNNDLGWRVVLPALLVATPMAAVWLARGRGVRLLAALGFGALGLVQTAVFAGDYTLGRRPGAPADFVQAQAMWPAVRALTGRDERIANNPHDLETVTPWAVNIGWALLSDRPSCYAGWETVLAYGAMPRARLLAMNGRSRRLFAGVPVEGDIRDLRDQDHCDAVLVTSRDPAWQKPFWKDVSLFKPLSATETWSLYELRKK
jgi:hypothetical protein